jgi:hypothetical protein
LGYHHHMPNKDYSHRTAVDKLGIKPGHAVALVPLAGTLDPELSRLALERSGRKIAAPDESSCSSAPTPPPTPSPFSGNGDPGFNPPEASGC